MRDAYSAACVGGPLRNSGINIKPAPCAEAITNDQKLLTENNTNRSRNLHPPDGPDELDNPRSAAGTACRSSSLHWERHRAWPSNCQPLRDRIVRPTRHKASW